MKKSTLMLSVGGALCAVLLIIGLLIRSGEQENKESTTPTGETGVVDIVQGDEENATQPDVSNDEYEIMYVTENIYAYENTDLEKQVGVLSAGTQVQRVEIVNKLFSKIIHNDGYAYVLSDYLSESTEDVVEETEPVETQPPEPEYFEDDRGNVYTVTNEEVEVEMDVNMRKGPTKGYASVTILKSGQTVTRIGVGENGWSKLRLSDGSEGYVASYYLTPVKTPVYTEVSETVYLTQDANVRTGPTIRREQVGEVKKNVAILRIGIGSDGWSKVIYDGEEAYIYSMYLTTVSPYGELVDNATYKDVDETVYASTKVNLRMGPGSSYVAITTLQKGDSIRRIGVGSNGWSKVIYNGQEVYAATKYLTDKAPANNNS